MLQPNCVRLVVITMYRDSESKTEMPNCDPKRCYQHTVKYQTKLSDIVTIIISPKSANNTSK